MKCQIVLVGGQLLPIYLGINEFQPDRVISFLSQESLIFISRIEKLFPKIAFERRLVDPFDFEKIKQEVETFVNSSKTYSFQLNLTSGTKVMALAANAVFQEKGLESIYYNQGGKFYSFKRNQYINLTASLSIDTFLRLSGHDKYSSKKISDYPTPDIKLVRNAYKKLGSSSSEDPSRKSHLKLGLSSTGQGWELAIADVVNRWELKKEMLLNVDLKTRDPKNVKKNEIDIVLNTGRNLIFIECKSGHVDQTDVNKMRAIKRIYGGIAARSILVCQEKPRLPLLERCKDLEIDVFYFMKRKTTSQENVWAFNSLENINAILTNLIQKSEL